MQIKCKYDYTQRFLPTTRHRKVRKCVGSAEVIMDIAEPAANEFPVAFIVHDMCSVGEGAKNWKELSEMNTDFRMFDEPIRIYKDRLYMSVRVTYGAAISTEFEDQSYIEETLARNYSIYDYYEDANLFTDDSVVVGDDSVEVAKTLSTYLQDYVYFDGHFWEVCKEPRYVIQTFGLGHNHASTAMFITQFYNPNISRDNYFSALQRDEAINYGKAVALRRGDTNSIEGFGDFDNIEVLIPEAVKVNPNTQHGTGNEFLNTMESITENSRDTTEAALLTMMAISTVS